MNKNLVIIPTYNEKENIARMIDTVLGFPAGFNILIVDDNSPDGTADVVTEYEQKFSGRVFLLQRPGKLGLGTAYIEGFRWALKHGYDFIFEMDADAQRLIMAALINTLEKMLGVSENEFMKQFGTHWPTP